MKEKGSRAERELVHLFWESGFGALRCPGSGSTPLPSPDVLATDSKRYLAIECKSIKSSQKSFKPEEIAQLEFFAEKFGAEPWIAMRFDKKGWYFLKTQTIKKTKNNNYSITFNHALEHGIRFEELIKKGD